MRRFSELAADEVLRLAIGIEDANAEHYEEWADRFRPFNEEVSELLDELVGEEKEHGDALRKLYREQYGEPIRKIDPEEVEERIENPQELEDHFFVINKTMAKDILQAALTTELKARRFYAEVLEWTSDPELLKVYKPLAAFEEEHVRVIKARLKQFQR
jgi:rubrerythrin